MKPSEAFGVIVRTVGLLLVLSAIWVLVCALRTPGLILPAIPMILGGIWLLRGAPALIMFAYPDEGGSPMRLLTPLGLLGALTLLGVLIFFAVFWRT